MALDVGSVKGSIVVGDEFSATFSAIDAKIAKLQSQFDALSAKIKDHSSKTKSEVDKIKDSYSKLAASLDPVIAGEQKLAKAHDTLSAALSKGLITQQQHQDLLKKAEEKYKNLENPLATLKGKVGELTETIAKFGGEAGEGLNKVASGLLGLGADGAKAVSGLGPLLPIVAGLAIALAGVSLGIKAFDWLKDTIKDGIETEDVISKLNATLRINGSNSGLSARQMVEYAEDLEFTTKATKEQIVAVETQLSRFSNIGSNFKEITKLTLDLAAAKRVDADTIVRQLGPAMDGNVRSLRALKEEGITFQPAQLKMMQAMIDGGHAAEFQAKLIELLKSKVEGLAEAQKDKLSVQTANVGKVYHEFKEGIASEVIPALEDGLNALVRSVGGWINLKNAVKNFAHEIGDTIRQWIYNQVLDFYFWEIAIDKAAIAMDKGVILISRSVQQAANVMSLVPGMGDAWAVAAQVAGAALNNASKDLADDTKALWENKLARAGVVTGLEQHRQALEGDDDTQGQHGNLLDKIKGKLKEQVNVLVDFEKAIRSVTEAMQANILKSNQSLADQERLLKASLEGVRAYEVAKATIEAETKVRERQAEVTKELNKIQDAALTALNKLDDALKNGKVSAADYAHQHAQIEIEAKAAKAAVESSAAAIDLNATKANLAKATMSAWLEISKNLTAQNEAMGEGVGEVTRQIIDLQKALDKQVSEKQAQFIDWQTQSDFAQRYGKDLEGIYERYGLLSKATETLALNERILAAQQAAIAKNPLVSGEQLARIRDLIVANQQAIDTIKAQWAAADINKWVNEPLVGGAKQFSDAWVDTWAEWLKQGKFSIDSFEDALKSFKDTAISIFIDLIKDWLKRWLAAIATRNAADAATNWSSGGAGGSGSSGAGSLLSAFSSSGASSWGQTAGYAFLAYVGVNLISGFLHQSDTVSGGRASIGANGSIVTGGGNAQLAAQARAAMQDLVTQVNDLARQWHLTLTQLTQDSVSIEQRSDGTVIVRTLQDAWGKIFSSMKDALAYAETQALRFAQYSSQTSALVLAAIHNTQATDPAKLQSDIEFAQRLVTETFPVVAQQLVQQITSLTQTLVDDFHHVLELFGPGKLPLSANDISQLGSASAAVINTFVGGLQAIYDQLTGHKEDIKQQLELQRQAYNAQRAIIIAQITLLMEEVKARIAEYQATQLGWHGPNAGGGGLGPGDRGPRDDGGQGSNPVAAFGDLVRDLIKTIAEKPPVPAPPTPDPRNPSNDPGLAALLQVLDNLARALQGLPPDIAPGGVHAGGGGGRGGAGGSGAADLAQLIKDADWQKYLSGMSEFQRQLAEINKKYDEAIASQNANSNALERAKRAHDEAVKAAAGDKDKIKAADEAYRKQLEHIGKTQKAIEEANRARAEEIALAKQQAATKLREELRPYTSEFGLSDWQKKQAANQRTYEQELKDSKDTGVPKWLVDVANFNRGVELAGEAVSSLGLPLQGLIEKGKTLTSTVSFLRESVSKGTLSIDEFNSVWGELINQSKLDLLSLASQIAQSTGDDAKAAEIKAKMDEINFAIQRAQFNILLDQYEALGTITGTDKSYMEGLRDWINNLHPDFTAKGSADSSKSLASSADTISSATSSFQSAVDQFKQATDSLLQSFNNLFGSTNQLGGSAQDRLAIAQAQFRSIEQGALAGDVTARGKYGAAAENYLNVLSEANAGGALFGAERDRLRAEFETLLAQTRFTLNGVSYDSGLGAPITPVSVGGQPNVGGYTGPVTVPSGSSGGSGSLSSDVTGVLQQILTALLTGNANLSPVLNSVSNNSAKVTTSNQAVNSNLDRLIAAVYQWLNAA